MEDQDLDIELVEQPVNAHDLKGMKFITERVSTKILADESVFSTMDAIRLLEEGAADLINIKLMKTGGIYEALKICSVAETYGVGCMIGCMLESKLSVSAAAHLAAGKSVISLADLDGPSLCLRDPYKGGPLYDGSVIRMPEEYGIGIVDIEDAMEISYEEKTCFAHARSEYGSRVTQWVRRREHDRECGQRGGRQRLLRALRFRGSDAQLSDNELRKRDVHSREYDRKSDRDGCQGKPGRGSGRIVGAERRRTDMDLPFKGRS